MTTFRYRDDESMEQPAVTLDAFIDQSNATAVRLESDEDARALIPYLDRLALIEIAFPSFRDGRGYSSARVLREAGYRGSSAPKAMSSLIKSRSCGAVALTVSHPPSL